MSRWKIKQCRRTESNQKWGNYTNYLGWSETSTLIRWHLNRNLSTVKEQAKQIPREEATSGTALPLRGNGVGAWVQYLINSKEQLWLEGGKGEMIMKLERCWRPDDERAELSGSPRNLCVPPKRPASDFPQHPNSPLHCLPQDHQESSHRTPFPYHTCPYKKTKTHSLGSTPHMVIHIMFSDLTCYFPLHHLKYFYWALSNSNQLPTKCPVPSASSVYVHFIWLKQKPEFPEMTLSSL